jgi:hypothetical protein
MEQRRVLPETLAAPGLPGPHQPLRPGKVGEPMAQDLLVDPDALREQVRGKYREVALDPGASFHFHTGRALASRLGYEADAVGALPDRAVDSFAGVGNPFSLRRLTPGDKVVDVGSGAGFDSFIAATLAAQGQGEADPLSGGLAR